MIMHNSPEPRMNAEERLMSDEPIVIESDSDSSDDDVIHIVNNDESEFGYELLPQDIANGDDIVNVNTVNSVDSNPGASNWARFVENEIEECTRKNEECDNKERREIEVNLEEVRAAMRNITLPPSAIPDWATNIPESEWNKVMSSILPKRQ